MSKLVCLFHTETNGLHDSNVKLLKKYLYKFARMVVLSYNIGYYENKKFIITKSVSTIIKPRSMFINNSEFHSITHEIAEKDGQDIESVLLEFIQDINKVEILISHNAPFHINTIISECIRYNIQINISNHIIIDTMTFNNDNTFKKLSNL